MKGPVDGADGQCRIERHRVVSSSKRLEVRAYLVTYVSRRCGPIAANNHHIHLTPLHQMPAEIIRYDSVRHAVRSKLESRQRCALVARAGFVHPYMHRYSSIVGHVD